MSALRDFNRPYEGAALDQIAFPIGGLGAGMFCLEGGGAFSHFSIQHRPDIFNERCIFSAVSMRDDTGTTVARVVEGPVPPRKLFFPWDRTWSASAMGGAGRSFGLPRYAAARFEARFPFANVMLTDPQLPVAASLVGWSPFLPGDADASSLPVAAVEYQFRNVSAAPQEIVYSFHAENFLRAGDTGHSVRGIEGGFHLRQESLPMKLEAAGSFAAWIDDPGVKTDLAWFRGNWFDPLTMLWRGVAAGRVEERAAPAEGAPSLGGSLYLPFRLGPGEEKTVRLLFGWHVPYSALRHTSVEGLRPTPENKDDFFQPWYATRFADIGAVASYWTRNVASLREATQVFTDCFHDSTLPPEVIEAVAANLSILKSPTVLRQRDGTLWAWEGCQDEAGSCTGTCTHVWNYAQALPHLFPALERGLRETEFFLSQDERGHQNFRSFVPSRPADHEFHAAADGQLGGVLKVHREWRISGDTAWLRRLWPQVRRSLDYCIETWDPDRCGALIEPHHNTYDIEFWGAEGMGTSFYLAALHAVIVMGEALGEDVAVYAPLLNAGRRLALDALFNGEYFIQKTQWTGLRSPDPVEMSRRTINVNYSTEALAILKVEGPKYQYGEGCLSDGVVGEWLAWSSGLPPTLPREKIEDHLLAVHRYNFRRDLSDFPNPQRPAYAFGQEGGLLLCTWPRGAKPSLPMVYCDEVWTGIEYQVASHLISLGHVEKGLEIVRACRARYDGVRRNPFDEFECGHWYARAMASYALLHALSGARYDAVEQVLHLEPKIQGDFRCFLATASGFGTVGVKGGSPFLEVRAGRIDFRRIAYQPADASRESA